MEQPIQEENMYKTYCEKLIEGIPGATSIIISDRDGVSIISVGSGTLTEEAAGMATAFSVSAEQASKLRLGNCKTIVNMYTDYVVVHLNHLPIVVSIFGTTDCNIGLVLDLSDNIKSALSPLRNKLVVTLDIQ